MKTKVIVWETKEDTDKIKYFVTNSFDNEYAICWFSKAAGGNEKFYLYVYLKELEDYVFTGMSGDSLEDLRAAFAEKVSSAEMLGQRSAGVPEDAPAGGA